MHYIGSHISFHIPTRVCIYASACHCCALSIGAWIHCVNDHCLKAQCHIEKHCHVFSVYAVIFAPAPTLALKMRTESVQQLPGVTITCVYAWKFFKHELHPRAIMIESSWCLRTSYVLEHLEVYLSMSHCYLFRLLIGFQCEASTLIIALLLLERIGARSPPGRSPVYTDSLSVHRLILIRSVLVGLLMSTFWGVQQNCFSSQRRKLCALRNKIWCFWIYQG